MRGGLISSWAYNWNNFLLVDRWAYNWRGLQMGRGAYKQQFTVFFSDKTTFALRLMMSTIFQEQFY